MSRTDHALVPDEFPDISGLHIINPEEDTFTQGQYNAKLNQKDLYHPEEPSSDEKDQTDLGSNDSHDDNDLLQELFSHS